MITRETLASQLRDYLQHRITRTALVDWADAMMEEKFEARDLDTVRDMTIGNARALSSGCELFRAGPSEFS